MKMITKIFNYLFSTDSLPVVGGATGALSQSTKLMSWAPEWQEIIYTIILAAIGAAVGYLMKLLLDHLFKKCK